MTWKPADANGSPIKRYLVSVEPGSRTVTVSGWARSGVVKGLVPKPYTLTVRGVNAVGTGKGSGSSAPRCAEDAGPT